MKNILLEMAAVLTLVFCASTTAVGQNGYPPGAFGYRALGLPLAPLPSNFSGGLPPSATGRFPGLGLFSGMYGFTPLWQPPYVGTIGPAVAPLPAAQVALPPQPPVGAGPAAPVAATTPAVQLSGPPLQPPAPLSASPASPAAQTIGAGPGGEIGPAWKYATGHSAGRAAFARTEPYLRSPELSALLTRIGQTRRMLAGPAINVYLSGNVALMRGVVRSTADRTVLRNVLGLEPNVSRIDDRLVVQGYVGRRAR